MHLAIDNSWSLFLDRDGVINQLLPGDYVKSPGELKILPGALEAITQLGQRFGRIVVVTNQQGIGKGLMTHDDLASIHNYLLSELKALGGHIDRIYYAHQLAAEKSIMRKPSIGMAQKAQKDFPEIDFSKSLMVGDSAGDMQFGRDAGMHCMLVRSSGSPETLPEGVLAGYNSLKELAENILG